MKEKLKKIVFILAAVFLCAGFLCSGPYKKVTAEETDGKKKNLVIGAAFASSDASYQQTLAGELEKRASEDKDFELKLVFADWNVKTQEEQLYDFIKEKVDAIILCPVNAKSYLNVLKDARNAGIPVINLNMKVDVVSTEYISTYVGASMSEEADLAAQLVVEALGEDGGKIGIIEGTQGSDPQIYRTQTFLEYLAGYPDIQVAAIVEGSWSREKAALAALDLIRKEPEIKLIYCHDSNMAIGVCEMLERKGRENIKVIGIGNEEEYMEAIRQGRLYGIVTQPSEYEASYAWSCAKRAAEGHTLRAWYKNPVQILKKDTVDDYISPLEE